jgi:hypothetical protein
MSDRRTVEKFGFIALILAVAIIGVAIFAGVSPLTQQSTGQQKATLSILLTDPPNVPSGVTAIYVEYSNLMVHISNAGNESGWYSINSGGIIDLMSVLNVSQTIGSAQLPFGTYNLLKFNISSATVTYEGSNYTAFVYNSEITVPIEGGVVLNSTQLNAILVDIYPTVVDIGSPSNHEFIISTTASACQMPNADQEKGIGICGYRMNLLGNSWWNGCESYNMVNLTITSASLSSSSLNLTVQNTGNGSSMLTEVIITPIQEFNWSVGNYGYMCIPQMNGSAIFYINSTGGLQPFALETSNTNPWSNNGTIIPMNYKLAQNNNGFNIGAQGNNGFNNGVANGFSNLSNNGIQFNSNNIITQYFSMLDQSGYNLTAGSSVVLSYSGQISLIQMMSQTQGSIVPGESYTITVIGNNSVANTVVNATAN